MTKGKLCLLFGITRQSYYQHYWRSTSRTIESELIINSVKEIRIRHPKIGGRKLYKWLKPMMNSENIKMGRDAFFDLLSAHALLVRTRKRRVNTTNSNHWMRRYPNLIRDSVPAGSNEVWVSDITYWKIKDKFYYISLITDAFSHKIVGYNLGKTLATKESVDALNMALEQLKGDDYNLIHHSDRGIHYCSSDYVKKLKHNGIRISMTESGDPLENPVAERVNGIIKCEYLETYQVNNFKEARNALSEAVWLYNMERPHLSIGYRTPNHIHETMEKVEREWKTYYQKRLTLVNPLQD